MLTGLKREGEGKGDTLDEAGEEAGEEEEAAAEGGTRPGRTPTPPGMMRGAAAPGRRLLGLSFRLACGGTRHKVYTRCWTLPTTPRLTSATVKAEEGKQSFRKQKKESIQHSAFRGCINPVSLRCPRWRVQKQRYIFTLPLV